MPRGGPLSADVLNPILEELEVWARETHQELLRAFYESGHPVGTVELTAAEQYEQLVRLRDAGHPDFWQNPEAQLDLDRLARQFGGLRPVAVPAQTMPGPSELPAAGPPQLALVPSVSAPAAGPGPGLPFPYPQAVTGGG